MFRLPVPPLVVVVLLLLLSILATHVQPIRGDEAEICGNQLHQKAKFVNRDIQRMAQRVEKLTTELLNDVDFLCGQNAVESCDRTTDEGIQVLNVSDHIMTAYCDQRAEGGGWTVIQRRLDKEEDFERDWDDYLAGFGNLRGNFWLGLDNIHLLTSSGVTLRVEVWDGDNKMRYAEYDKFSIDGADDNFALHVRGYSGTAGDSLGALDGAPFSTFDNDNDDSEENCAQASGGGGGWWYTDCRHANLNGLYKNSNKKKTTNRLNGIMTWDDANVTSSFIILKKSEMKIKRRT